MPMIRKCLRIDNRTALIIIISIICTHIRIANTVVNNNPDLPSKPEKRESEKDTLPFLNNNKSTLPDTNHCPANVKCSELPNSCLNCLYNTNCTYGSEIQVKCNAKIECENDQNQEIRRTMICRFCYQTERWEHNCEHKGPCTSVDKTFKSNCTVNRDILCFGRRVFPKRIACNWTQGYRWSTTLIISLTLGGFGVDRFFLGHWQEGIGKLFSFGGLGVWTLIDVLLISLHYLGPADGSLYI